MKMLCKNVIISKQSRIETSLGQVVSQKMIDELVARAQSLRPRTKKPFSELKNFFLSKNQYQDYLHELEKLMERYQSLSAQNSKLKRQTGSAFTSLVIVGERRMSIFGEIPELEPRRNAAQLRKFHFMQDFQSLIEFSRSDRVF